MTALVPYRVQEDFDIRIDFRGDYRELTEDGKGFKDNGCCENFSYCVPVTSCNSYGFQQKMHLMVHEIGIDGTKYGAFNKEEPLMNCYVKPLKEDRLKLFSKPREIRQWHGTSIIIGLKSLTARECLG